MRSAGFCSGSRGISKKEQGEEGMEGGGMQSQRNR